MSWVSYLNRAGYVETLLHTRDIQLDHPEVFAFDYDASHRSNKSERQVEDFKMVSKAEMI